MSEPGSLDGWSTERSKTEQNRPEHGTFNLFELLELLDRNPYYDELQRKLRAGAQFNNVRDEFNNRLALAKEYLEFLELTDEELPDDSTDVDVMTLGDYQEALIEAHLPVDPRHLKDKIAALEQVIDWFDGVKEIVTTKLENVNPVHEIILEFKALADIGMSYFAQVALEDWQHEMARRADPVQAAARLWRKFIDYREIAAAQGDTASVRQAQDVLNVLQRWYPELGR